MLNFNNAFGNEVRRARIAAGLTQQDLADRTDSDQRTVSLDETLGGVTPRRVRTLVRALNLSDPWLTIGLLEYVACKDANHREGVTPNEAYVELVTGLSDFRAAALPLP